MIRRFIQASAAILLLLPLLTLATDKCRDFTLKDMEGKTFRLSKQLEKGPVLIDFWATWCKPCVQELPSLDSLAKKFATNGLQVYAISIDNPKSQSKIKPFIKGSNYVFNVLLDGDMEVRQMFGGKDVPMTILVNKEGEILYRHLGYVKGDEKILDEQITKLFTAKTAVEDSVKAESPDK
jgi:peroxiredoxin